MSKKQEKVLVTTPAGVAIWPRLHEPDFKFNVNGEYNTKLAFDPADAAVAAFFARIESLVDAAFQKAKDENPKFQRVMKRISPIKPELDDDGNETGRMVLNLKRVAKVTSKKNGKTYTFRVMLYDSQGSPLPKGVNIGGGSILRASFEPSPYFNAKDKEAGISLRLEAVQVIELVEFRGSTNAAAFGFESVEGGFVADTFPEGEEAGDEFDTPAAAGQPNGDF